MIPDFQALMLPILQFVADGQEHTVSQTHDLLAQQFKLTSEEVSQVYSLGRKIFLSRVQWAKGYLKMAGLVENTKRAHYRITDKGREVLASKPTEITVKYLKETPEYKEWVKRRNGDKTANTDVNNTIEAHATPEDILESNYLEIRKNLAFELLSKVKSASPLFFESMVVELLVKMGYGGSIKEAGKAIGRSGDEGIDGIIKEDRLGLDAIYIQAKRWDGSVGRPEIQKFMGALAGQGAKKGIFITTAKFTNDAIKYTPRNDTKIVLIDGEQLADLMIDYDMAVATTHTFTIKRMDNDYFDEE